MSSGSSRRRRHRPHHGAQRAAESDFWGQDRAPTPDAEEAAPKVRPTTDPAVLIRSLGDPPLGPNPTVSSNHLAVIYEEAVKAAIALAAANGLLDERDTPAG